MNWTEQNQEGTLNVLRLLQSKGSSGSSDASSSNGTLAILIVVSILFFCIWCPSMLRRLPWCTRPNPNTGLRRETAIQAQLRRLNHFDNVGPHGMSLADRRDFVSNVLVTKYVVAKDAAKDVAKDVELTKGELIISPSERKIESPEDETEEDLEFFKTCAICLTPYQDGEEVCWSHNMHCNHVFHRECILAWLIRKDDCPLCRHNFLAINDDEEADEENQIVHNGFDTGEDPSIRRQPGETVTSDENSPTANAVVSGLPDRVDT